MALLFKITQFTLYSIALLQFTTCNAANDQMLEVSNTWIGSGDRQNCPSGSVAVGFRIKYDGRLGNGDKTGLNAIELRCADRGSGSQVGTITSDQGDQGSWADHWYTCPSGSFLKKFALDIRGEQYAIWGPADDTSVENIRFTCGTRGNSPGVVIGDDTGAYGEWSESCRGQTAICGMKTLIDDPPFYELDRTGLNDVKFYCC